MPIFKYKHSHLVPCTYIVCTCSCFPAIQVDDVVRTIEGTEVSVESMSSFSDVEAIAKVQCTCVSLWAGL